MTKTTIILHSETLGKGNDELGKTIRMLFLRSLWASDKKPDTIIFYNSAVHLMTDKSSVLDALLGFHRLVLILLRVRPVSVFMKSKRKSSSVESLI